MPRQRPSWKLVLALLSILLAGLVWTAGLQESFDRPSVNPALSLKQKEIALLAEPAIPHPLKEILVGFDPQGSLRDSLRDIPIEELDDRQRLLLASVEPLKSDRRNILSEPFVSSKFELFREGLISGFSSENTSIDFSQAFDPIKEDALLARLTCLAAGFDNDSCLDFDSSKNMAIRLGITQFFPAIAVLLGSLLLIRQAWMLVRKSILPWPSLTEFSLDWIDMVLLVAGGFVVLGEVTIPSLVAPLIVFLAKGLADPIGQALKVVFGYFVMTVPPLLILRQQLKSLKRDEPPLGGWLQWRIFPLNSAIASAINGWLMILPPVLLVSWWMSRLLGDQGGSNPLLEIVLNSKDPLAILLLVFTTVILAPLFEETIFRGVLLPVLGNSIGKIWAIILSALVFALAHLSVGELVPLFVLGLGLACVRLSSGRLFPCVLMHAFWNGITFTNLLILGGY